MKSIESQHPFIHEYIYREFASQYTGGDLENAEKVLEPLIGKYISYCESLLATAESYSRYAETGKLLAERPWWWLLPTILPPYTSHHEVGMTYAIYRLMTTGNMTFMVGMDLAKALYNTDYVVKVGDLKLPAETFIVYFQGSIAPVGPTFLKWIFVDRVPMHDGTRQIRLVYGFTDEDGDDANSDFLLFNGQDDLVLSNDQLVEQLDAQKVSNLSLLPIKAVHRQNVVSVFTSLINFLLYMEALNDYVVVKPAYTPKDLAGLQNPKKLRRREKELQRTSLYRYSYVGGSYESRMKPEESGTGHALTHRVLVRGHWRHQWIGSQRDEEGNRIPGTAQKLAWIEPYWKNPALGDDGMSIRIVK